MEDAKKLWNISLDILAQNNIKILIFSLLRKIVLLFIFLD